MIEKEIKKMCSFEEFRTYKILLEKSTRICNSENRLQINYYYDTFDYFLNKNHETLRVRQKDNHIKLQYKYNKRCENMSQISQEFEMNLEKFPIAISSQILPKLYPDISDMEYFFVGVLVTERKNYSFKSAIISFDTNYYLGLCDYEIEIEYQDYNDALEIVSLLNIDTYNPCFKGKYSRFVDTLTEGLC